MPPANDNFAGAQLLVTPSGSLEGTNVDATNEASDPLIAALTYGGGASVWYKLPIGWDGFLTVELSSPADPTGQIFDTVLGVFKGTSYGALTVLGTDDDSGAGNYSKLAALPVSAGDTVYIEVDGYSGEPTPTPADAAQGTFKLTWEANCGYALKANGKFGTSYVTKPIGDQSEVWLTFEVAFTPAALALWTEANNFSGAFGDIFRANPITPWSSMGGVYLSSFFDGSAYTGAGEYWGASNDPSQNNTPAPTPDVWQLVEVQTVASTGVTTAWINGTEIFSSDYGYDGLTADSIRAGLGDLENTESSDDNIVYIKNIKAGTTRGASNLFADDFSTGTLDAWDVVHGNVSVVGRPYCPTPELPADGDFPEPLGISFAFGHGAHESPRDWTRVDDPGQPSESSP